MYDTQVTLEQAFEQYSAALKTWAETINQVIEHSIETQETVKETLELQKEVLLNQ